MWSSVGCRREKTDGADDKASFQLHFHLHFHRCCGSSNCRLGREIIGILIPFLMEWLEDAGAGLESCVSKIGLLPDCFLRKRHHLQYLFTRIGVPPRLCGVPKSKTTLPVQFVKSAAISIEDMHSKTTTKPTHKQKKRIDRPLIALPLYLSSYTRLPFSDYLLTMGK